MRIRTDRDLGSMIREARRLRGITQQDLASCVGVTQRWISQVENGKPRAEIALVLRTLATLGIAIDMQDPAAGTAAAPAEKPVGFADYPDINSIVDRR